MNIKLYQPLAINELGHRPNQEDSVWPALGTATQAGQVFIMCDGMGGHEKGEVASGTMSKALGQAVTAALQPGKPLTVDQFRQALEQAYQALDAKDDGSPRKMGCTLTFLCFHAGGCTAAHIGDSRIYHIRPAEHRLLYKSRDHSLVFELYQSGEITEAEMATHPQKNVITRAVQPGIDNRVKPDVITITDIKPGDYFYICSDGMLEQMTDQELVEVFAAPGSDEKKRQQLIAATVDNNDNHSAYIVHVASVELGPTDAQLPNEELTAKCNALNVHPVPADEDPDVSIDESEDPDVSIDETPNVPPFRPQAPAPVRQPRPAPRPAPQQNYARQQRQSYGYAAQAAPAKDNGNGKKILIAIAALVLAVIVILGALMLLGGDDSEKSSEESSKATPKTEQVEGNQSGNNAANKDKETSAAENNENVEKKTKTTDEEEGADEDDAETDDDQPESAGEVKSQRPGQSVTRTHQNRTHNPGIHLHGPGGQQQNQQSR